MCKKKKYKIFITKLFLIIGCMAMLCACSNNSNKDTKTTQKTTEDSKKLPSYNVTLDPNGGTFSDGSTDSKSIKVKEGTAIDFAKNVVTSDGNTITGWYQADGMPWPGARKVKGDITLKAKWLKASEEVTLPLTLTIKDEAIPVEFDNGAYQFTKVSYIYGGYAQRNAKYTVYEKDLLAATKKDDGKKGRVLCLVKSNYVDTTGSIYGEFYNDGEFELFYEYTYQGKTTKYCMETGYWTYEGYTAPLANTPIPKDDTGMGYTSAHLDWDRSLVDTATEGEKK